jgi:kynurenine 3-monooxygenase
MKSITIVGAGLVGTLWAILLRQKGYEVSLYEKRSDPRKLLTDQGRSINLIVTSRGLCGLKRAGLLNEALAITIPVFGRMVHGKTGEAKFQPYGREDECNFSISRFKLNNFLLDAAEEKGVNLHFEHQLSELEPATRKVHFLHDQKMVSIDFDLLFGADGAGSEVRKKLTNDKTQWLEADYKEITLPAGTKGEFLLNKKALHIWPRGSHMLMALANPDSSFTMTLYLPRKGEISFENINTPTEIKNLFETEFPDVVSLLPNYIDEFQENPQGTLGTVRCSQWTFNNSIALIGDAAHAIIPFFGQGMNSGFEDCTTLVDLLDLHQNNWEKVLETFEKNRKLETNAIADMSIENWTEMRDKVGDNRFLLRKKVEGWLEEQFQDIYKSRYGMITYTLIPYSLAQKAGVIQSKILDELCKNILSPDEIPKEKAHALLKSEFLPFLKENRIKLDHYLP